MPGLGEFGQFAKAYGLPVAILACGIVVLWRENQRLHAKLIELLDQRGKFMDSILSEAINAKSSKRVS